MGQRSIFKSLANVFRDGKSIFSDILGGGRLELNTMPPIVSFSDMFFIQNQHLEVLRYERDRRYNFGDHHPLALKKLAMFTCFQTNRVLFQTNRVLFQ